MKKEEIGTEEIYLMPETETAEAGKPLAELTTVSKKTEKFVFTVFYALADKEVILSELKKMGAVIINHSDKDGAVTAKMSMAQLAAIKTLECVERVEVAKAVKQSKKSLTNKETQDMLNIQQAYAATANASVSRANTNNNGVSLLCYDDGDYSGGDCSNDISTAIHLPLSTWMSGDIHCPGAEMWYRFTASASNAAEYSIYTTGALDTVGYLYDSNGDYIAENDDNDGLNFGITSELSYGATYYICVQAYGDNTGDFSLRVDYTTESSSGNDSYGNGSNDMSTAIALPLSTWRSGDIHCPGTEVWYRFTASVSNASQYTVYTTGSLDTMGHLYDANGDLLDSNDDSGGDLNFSITSELTYGATYYVCVSAYGGNTGSYDIRVDYETVSEEPDDNGYSNDMSSAINLSLNSWHSGEIYCPGAEMWYKFTPSTTAYYTLYTVGSLDTVGHIYDADCNQLDGDDDAGAGLNFKMVARLTAGHTYYVQVAAYADNTGYFSIAVTNTVFVEYVEIDQSYIELDKGETVTLTATVEPSYATNKTLHWETSDSSVATVNQSGVVTARGAGTACIRAYSQDGSDKSSCCEVWVDVPVQSVTINTTSLLMRVGEQEDLDAEICPPDAVNQLIYWTSTDTSVVWVNAATGQVEARGEGNATVYATAQDGTGVRGSCAIQVEPPIAVQGIDICCDNYTMNVGDTAYLSYDIYPSDATNQSVTWCSSDENVATVELQTGIVCAKDAGTAVITATTIDGAFESSSVITVHSTDPFHHSNIEFLRIKKYDMSSYGGDSDITTIVTKSTLSSDQYFEAMAADRANVAFIINDALKNELNTQATLFQSTAIMFTVPFYFYLAKLGVDNMVSNGIISDESAEYYGIWASETNRLLREANKISNLIQLTLAVVTMVYSIYSIVSAIKAAKMSMNSTQTYYSASYKTAVDNTDELFDELSAAGTKYTKENTMWICRNPDGKICWLETGTDNAGFKHILNGHPVSSFSSFNVSSEVGVSSLIYDVVSTQTPVGTYGADGLVYAYGGNKYLNVVISTNGYIVNAYNVSNDIGRIIFY